MAPFFLPAVSTRFDSTIVDGIDDSGSSEGVASVLKRLSGVFIVLLSVPFLAGSASAAGCWDSVTPQQDLGFDYAVDAVVQGPDFDGIYIYTYRIYRLDQGAITYRDPSHVSLNFGCDSEPAWSLIIGGAQGLLITGDAAHACQVEVATDPAGFAEPGLDRGCRTNGIKIEFCDGALEPDGDGVSYPDDPDDPVLTIQFQSLADPSDGHWLVKGGRKFTGGWGSQLPGSTTFLTDGGTVPVPGCRPPLPVEAVSWSHLKQIYR